MQQLTIIQPLADLFRQTAVARQAFEDPLTIAAELLAHLVKPVGRSLWHLVYTTNDKVCGFRRSFQRALEHADPCKAKMRLASTWLQQRKASCPAVSTSAK